MAERGAEGREPAMGPHSELIVPPRVPWDPVSAAMVIVFWLLLQAGLGALFGGWGKGLGPQLAVVAISDAGAVVLAVVLVSVWAAGRERAGALLGLRRPAWSSVLRAWKVMVAGAGAYACVWAATVNALRYLGPPWEEAPVQPLARMVREASSARLVACALVAGAVIAPVAEEVVFRSLLYLPLRQRLGVLPAAAIVAALFAAAHTYPWGAANLFVLSLTFTALYERTGSLWTAIAAHGAFNGLMMLLLRVVSG